MFGPHSCVLKMTVSMEKPTEAASPRSGFNNTVKMKVTTQTTFKERKRVMPIDKAVGACLECCYTINLSPNMSAFEMLVKYFVIFLSFNSGLIFLSEIKPILK